jgi:ubiquitin carboxyl-terminal hydrolase L3
MSDIEEYDRSYRSKYYIPLESNPQVFTQLIHNLGLTSLEFQDVLSLDEPSLLALVTRPVLGLVLTFPTTEVYKKYRKGDEERKMYKGKGEDEDVVWYDQTIGNACGLYGILHSISNGKARSMIRELHFAREYG